MDVTEAITKARDYIQLVYEGEQITNLGLEETEHDETARRWMITLAFSRPWNTPRTRAQEVLENLGAVSGLKRSYKTVTLSENGVVISMKNRSRADVEG